MSDTQTSTPMVANEVVLADGRKMTFEKPDILTRMALYEVLDPKACRNAQYLGTAIVAASVLTINGVPVEPISDRNTMFRILKQIGEDGLIAVSEAIAKQDAPGNETT